MEITSRHQERENPSPTNSPHSSTSSNGGQQYQQILQTTPPSTPKPNSRSEPNNPYPTTFIQADTATFKQVVQRLTGSESPAKSPSSSDPPISKNHSIPPLRTGQKKQGFKLYERRNQIKNGLIISPLMQHQQQHGDRFSGKSPEILSPSILDFPSLVLSPVTPLIEDPFDKSSSTTTCCSSEVEERAIAEKGFYFHPSPRNLTPGESEPRLLPLFPVTSPRVSGDPSPSSSSSSAS